MGSSHIGNSILRLWWAFLLFVVICTAGFSGCGSGGNTPPVPPPPNNPVVHKPFRAVQVCMANYPYTHQAMTILSRWLASSVQSSEDGLDAYVNGVTAPGDVSSGTFFSLSLPAIASVPPKPVTPNPFDAKLTGWHTQVSAIETQVQQVQTQVNEKVTTLRTLSPPGSSPTAAGLEGCITVGARIRFPNEPRGLRFLILAIPFLPVSLPRDFLKGIQVIGIDMYAPSVAQADYSGLCARFLSSGAAACRLYDSSPSSHLTSPF